jgi:hypothetical protein
MKALTAEADSAWLRPLSCEYLVISCSKFMVNAGPGGALAVGC